MKASELADLLPRLISEHGDRELFMDVGHVDLYPVGEVGLDVEETGFIIWKPENEEEG